MSFRYRTIRFFISSTFADMEPERNAVAAVMARLQKEYSSVGWTVEYIDMRWGVTKEASADNHTMRICLEELKRCRQVSPRPNFLFLIGDRYGWLPLPEIISPAEWNRLYEAAELHERQSMAMAYELDSNALPDGRYLLRAIKSQGELSTLHGLFDRVDKERRLSATEQEIVAGIFDVNDAKEHVVGYIRELKEVPASLRTKYFDEAPAMTDPVGRLKKKLSECLPAENILYRRDVDFSTYLSPEYLCEFEKEIEARVRIMVDREIKAHFLPQAEYLHNFYFDLAEKNSRYFYGREAELSCLMSYVLSDGPQYPLLVAGEPGVGKSSFMSKGILTARIQMPFCVIVPRFIGSGDGIYTLTDLVVSVFNALHQYFTPEAKMLYPHLIDRYEGALFKNNTYLDETWFHKLENLLLPGKYVIFIDAIDQLDSSDHTTLFNCLTTGGHINPYGTNKPTIYNSFEKLRIVVSVAVTENRTEIYELDRFQTLQFDPFDEAGRHSFVKGLLESTGRKVSPPQEEVLAKALQSCDSRGIYLDLAGKYFGFLPSFAKIADFPPDFPNAAGMILEKMMESGIHNRNLLRMFLAVIASAPDGVDIHSLNGILASDEGLVKEIANDSFHSFDTGASTPMLPPILLSRLYSDLVGIFIATRPSLIGDAICIRHQQTLGVVKEWLGPEILHQARLLQHKYYSSAWKEDNRFAVNEITRVTREVCDAESTALQLATVLCDVDYLARRLNISEKTDLMADYDALILLSEDVGYLRPMIPGMRQFAALLNELPDRIERDVFIAWCHNLSVECFITGSLHKVSRDKVMTDQLRQFDFSRAIVGNSHSHFSSDSHSTSGFKSRYLYSDKYYDHHSVILREDRTDGSVTEVFRVDRGKSECRLRIFNRQNLLVMISGNEVGCFNLTSGEQLLHQEFQFPISPMAAEVYDKGRYLVVSATVSDEDGPCNAKLIIDLKGGYPTRQIPQWAFPHFSRSGNYAWLTYGSDRIIRMDMATGICNVINYENPKFPPPLNPGYHDFFIHDALDDKALFNRGYEASTRSFHQFLVELNGTSVNITDLPECKPSFSEDGKELYVCSNHLEIVSLDDRTNVRQYPFPVLRVAVLNDKTMIGLGYRKKYYINPLYDLDTCISEHLHLFPITYQLDISGFSTSADGRMVCVSNFQSGLRECIVIYKYTPDGWRKQFLHPDFPMPSYGLYATWLSPSDDVVACSGAGGGKCWIKLISTTDSRTLLEIPVPGPVSAFRFSSDGSFLVASDATDRQATDFRFRILKFSNGSYSSPVITETAFHTDTGQGALLGYFCFDLMPDDRTVVFNGLAFDLFSGETLTQRPLPTSHYYYHIYGYEAGKREIRLLTKGGFVIGSGYGKIEILDTTDGLRVEAESDDIPVAVSPDGSWMLMRTPGCDLYRTDISLRYRLTLKETFPKNVINALFHPVRKAFYAITRDAGVYFCDLEGNILAYALALDIIDARVTPEGLVVLRDGGQVSVFEPADTILKALPRWEMDDTLMCMMLRRELFGDRGQPTVAPSPTAAPESNASPAEHTQGRQRGLMGSLSAVLRNFFEKKLF